MSLHMWTIKSLTRLQGCSVSPYVNSEVFYEATRVTCLSHMWTAKSFTRLQRCSVSPYVDSEVFYELQGCSLSPYVDSEVFYEATRMQCLSICEQ